MSRNLTRNQVLISAVVVWAMMLGATFAFFFWLNDATGQMDWQTYQALRESKAKEKTGRAHQAD